ncbi:MAG: hypothetical protein ACI9SK_000883 [Zhongshania sp.]|jgi:hypothetical protein
MTLLISSFKGAEVAKGKSDLTSRHCGGKGFLQRVWGSEKKANEH